MPLDTVGILTVIDFAAEQPTVLSAVEREVFVDEVPLFGRLPHMQATSQVYNIVSYDVRQHTALALQADFASTSSTTLSLTDTSTFMTGDVFEITDGTHTERVEVTGPPVLTTTPNTLPIRRAREGSTAYAFVAATPSTARFIANSRTGGEIDQQAHRPIRTTTPQYLQTMQYPCQVGGLAEAIQNVALPPGANSVMGLNRAVQAVEFARDCEYAMYYGVGEAPTAAGDRAKMKGLKTLINAYNGGSNVKLAAGASYTRANFIADVIQPIYSAGGRPDTILCATNFLSFLDTWVPGKQSVMGNTETKALGFPITTFVNSLGGAPLTFVPSLQLRAGTAAVLTSSDLDVRYIREMYWQPRERRGDAIEGDWIGDYSINMKHPQWHAWVEGITSAA